MGLRELKESLLLLYIPAKSNNKYLTKQGVFNFHCASSHQKYLPRNLVIEREPDSYGSE